MGFSGALLAFLAISTLISAWCRLITGESNHPFVVSDCRPRAGRLLARPMCRAGRDSVKTMRLSGKAIASGDIVDRLMRTDRTKGSQQL